uniref:Uncharacterized protein n=1 Tax=Tanacetum cinerariifolium TaxID=118510 RepID=A0A699HNN8_TANCI|nr:hypothetical protein [Tanacetum cinerariifolium]
MLYHYKLGLSQVEARLAEFKNQEIKFCEKIRGLEFNVECKNNRIERLTNKLEELKKEKEGLESKLTVYSPPKKDISWTGLPKFADDTITDNSRPFPSIEIDRADVKTNKVEAAKKPYVKYAKMYRNTHKSPKFDHLAYNCGLWVEKGKSWPKNNYTHKSMSPRTGFRNTGRTSIVNRPNMNVAQPKRTSFAKPTNSYVRRPFHGRSAVRTQS